MLHIYSRAGRHGGQSGWAARWHGPPQGNGWCDRALEPRRRTVNTAGVMQACAHLFIVLSRAPAGGGAGMGR
jgi:hypothetical protein